jgi:hypothetical protein
MADWTIADVQGLPIEIYILYYTSMFQERLDQMTYRSLKWDPGWHMWEHYDRVFPFSDDFKRLKMAHDFGSFSMPRTAMPALNTDPDMPDLVTNNTIKHNYDSRWQTKIPTAHLPIISKSSTMRLIKNLHETDSDMGAAETSNLH